jgi:hypothetical protein
VDDLRDLRRMDYDYGGSWISICGRLGVFDRKRVARCWHTATIDQIIGKDFRRFVVLIVAGRIRGNRLVDKNVSALP